jgi:DNA-binding NtrC family response regulator
MRNNTHRILLIEDNLADARLVQEAVRHSEPCRVQLAHCASLADAVAYLGREAVDLVLLDLDLPDASGLEALAQLDRTSPRTPVIVLTGLDDDATALEALRRGAQDLLVKGTVGGERLLRSVRYALERQRTLNLRSDLLKGIARQLKAPVDAIWTSAQVLLDNDGSALTERQARMLERVLNTADELRSLHDGMLDLARADEGPARAEISGLGGACVIEEIKRRMAKGLNAIEGEGAAPARAFAQASLGTDPHVFGGARMVRVLLLEDNPGDARLVQEILADSTLPIELDSSVCLTDSVRRLETEAYDVLLVDLGLPDASALEAVSEVARLAPRSSIIVLTGRDDDDAAMEALKKGAQDYLIKGQVDAAVLARSIRFARERQRAVNLRAELLEAIAGELRNPIHVVLGYSHLMLEKIPDPLTAEQAQALGNVLATTRTLRRLSEAMFDLAGAEKGPLREELRNADAAEVIDEIKRRMTHLLAVGGDREPVPRQTDPSQLETASVPGRLFRRVLRRLGKQPKQVLLIDPDYDSRTIIRTALESGAFEVVESCSESEVLDHLVSDKIALAVFERRTPNLAAPEVFEHVRKVAAYCAIPMLLLDADERTANRNSPEHRISKPFTPEQLLFAVDHALGRA